MLKSPVFWGIAVSTESSPGIYHLINICGDRLVIHGNIITNMILSPNPTTGTAEIDFISKYEGDGIVDVYNNMGLVEFKTDIFKIDEGENKITVDLRNLQSGTYSLIVKQGNAFAIVRVIVIK